MICSRCGCDREGGCGCPVTASRTPTGADPAHPEWAGSEDWARWYAQQPPSQKKIASGSPFMAPRTFAVSDPEEPVAWHKWAPPPPAPCDPAPPSAPDPSPPPKRGDGRRFRRHGASLLASVLSRRERRAAH